MTLVSYFCLAGLTRAFPPAEEAFLKSDGFSLLIRAMQDENDKLITKSAFMLRNMLGTNPSHKGIDLLCCLQFTVVCLKVNSIYHWVPLVFTKHI